MEDLLDCCFNVITARKPKAKAHFLETLKKRKCDNGTFNFMERLLGVARLLSEMVEPILKTAIEISTLFARSFFMGFSLMILALLGRLRVLVQQMLLDVVSLFNEVSSLAQKKQSIKITQDGIEVFREYYPMMDEVVTLNCAWQTDKFVLVETTNKVDISEDRSSETGQILKTSIKYRSIGISLEDDEPDLTKNDAHESSLDDASTVKRKRTESPIKLAHEASQIDQALISSNPQQDDSGNVEPDGVLDNSTMSTSPCLYKPTFSSNKKVAFISVAKPAPTTTSSTVFRANEFGSNMQGNKENPLNSFFNEEDKKDSIF
ncbi:uncharacterized protein LOC141612215 isoform X3 [Silene latifolia]